MRLWDHAPAWCTCTRLVQLGGSLTSASLESASAARGGLPPRQREPRARRAQHLPQAPAVRPVAGDERGTDALVARLEPCGRREQSASQRSEEIALPVHQEERDQVLEPATLLRCPMAQEPAH